MSTNKGGHYMGTRNLTMVQKNNEIVLAQYGQWDGYPTGNGLIILEFLKNNDLKKFSEKVNNLKYIENEELQKLWQECGAEPGAQFVSMDVAEEFNKKYPQLSRDTGASVLELIMNSTGELLVDNAIDFARSWSCEWGYLINLDTNELEVYTSSYDKKVSKDERFYVEGCNESDDCYPIVKIASYNLSNLPSDEEFSKLESIDSEEDDEEDMLTNYEKILETSNESELANILTAFIKDNKAEINDGDINELIKSWLSKKE